MQFRAVIFDLFGTLVKEFTRATYDPVIDQMAEVVEIPHSDFWRLVGETYTSRSLGYCNSFEANIIGMCSRSGKSERGPGRVVSQLPLPIP